MRRTLLISAAAVLLSLIVCGGAWALDEDAPALRFLPADGSVVMAIDIDQLKTYTESVGDTWRDADRAHFMEGLESLSLMMTREEGRPDVMTFFDALSGVQAFAFVPGEQMPLMVFSGFSQGDARILRNYTLAYIVEHRYQKALEEIKGALQGYYGASETDPKTGEEGYRHTYPESLDVLVEDGYLQSIPINPYTGETMRIVPFDTAESLGDIAYEPESGYGGMSCAGGSCAMPPQPAEGAESEKPSYYSFKLKSWHVYGVRVSGSWSKTLEPYSDLRTRLLALESRGWANMGFEVEAGRWQFFTPQGKEYAIAYGENFLLAAAGVNTLKEAVDRASAGEGFHFGPPEGFDTADAFYRDEADLSNLRSMIVNRIFEEKRGVDSYEGGMPPLYQQMLEQILGGVGLEALSRQHTAMWLRNGDIQMTRRVELTGDAQRSLIGSMVYSQPEDLMTAQGGPFELIGEAGWANPGEYSQAVMDYIFEYLIPMINSQSGKTIDPQAITGMLGLGNADLSTLADQVYVLATSSTDRGNGQYMPGLTAAIRTQNPDLHYIMTGIMDTITLMVPGLPISLKDFGDENAQTWVFNDPSIPLTPTLAWTDGWVVKSLWREDALAARDALESGTLFRPTRMGPANVRIQCNRQRLLRGIADVTYVIPEPQAAFAGGLMELAAQLSEPGERLDFEWVNENGYTEERCKFSVGLFEHIMPILAYCMRGATAE